MSRISFLACPDSLMDATSMKRLTGPAESGQPADAARRNTGRLHARRMAAALVAGITAVVLLGRRG
jgi:hypothetical protein